MTSTFSAKLPEIGKGDIHLFCQTIRKWRVDIDEITKKVDVTFSASTFSASLSPYFAENKKPNLDRSLIGAAQERSNHLYRKPPKIEQVKIGKGDIHLFCQTIRKWRVDIDEITKKVDVTSSASRL